MAKLVVLGSSNAIPSRDHENTHLAIVFENRTVGPIGPTFLRSISAGFRQMKWRSCWTAVISASMPPRLNIFCRTSACALSSRPKKTLVYSCDTEPCPEVERLAAGADILLHEAAGPFAGHSSATQAGDAARQAEVGVLYLIHYPTGRFASGDPLSEAKTRFQGATYLATDLMEINLG
jgi:hypothetical protein